MSDSNPKSSDKRYNIVVSCYLRHRREGATPKHGREQDTNRGKCRSKPAGKRLRRQYPFTPSKGVVGQHAKNTHVYVQPQPTLLGSQRFC